MLSKYTTIFFAVSILAWLLLVPELRKWLLTPWPWLCRRHRACRVFADADLERAASLGLGALPVSTAWSFTNGRCAISANFSSPRWACVTPPIFILGCMGLVAHDCAAMADRCGARVLINAMVWPIVLYFVWHTFHGRVEGNWPEPILSLSSSRPPSPRTAIQWNGAWASSRRGRSGLPFRSASHRGAASMCRRSSASFRSAPTDPTARALGAGWKQLGVQIDDVRKRLGAPVVLSMNYGAHRLAFVLSAVASAGRADQRAHALCQRARAGSGVV